MRRSLVLISSVVMLSASTGLPPASASAQSSSPGAAGPHIAYVHDELGRLEAVIDPSQGVARYRYDAVGNITAIERPNLTDVSVIEVTPDWGVPGDRVTIEGTEFDGDIASDRVTFGGIAAVVESASGTSLVARIPAGAVTGPITVTTPAGFATSTETFTVGSRAPAVTAVEPTIIHTGESLTITGRNLGSDPASLDVAAGRTHLRVEHSDGSSVAAFAPAATGSGRVSVSTPWGQADGPDLFVIPDVFPVEQIGVTARALQGVPLRLAVPPGAIAVILTDASAGTRLTLDVAEAAGTPTQLPISLFDGRSMAVQNATPFTSTWSTAGLHESGTYTILVDGTGSTIESPITLTVVSVTDPVVTIGSDRAPAVISLTRPGQHAVARLAGRAGDRVTLIADPVDPPGTAELRDPFGMLLASGQGPGIVMGPIELASDGGYTVIYTPFELAVGQVSLEVVGASPEESVAARTDGQPVQLDLPTPGQAAHVSFDGGKGARIAIVGAASGGCFDYTLDGPDGVIFAGATWCDGAEQLSEPLALPQSGTYDLSVTGEALVTGSVTVRLFEVTDAIGTIIPNGPALQVEFEVPGQNAGLTFPAVAGATYDVRFENIAVPRVTAQIVAPDGNVAFGNELDPAGLTASVGPALVEGDYIINLDPAGTATGSIEVSVTESSPGALHGRVAVVARGRAVKSALTTVRADATGSPAECPHVRSPSLAEAVLPNRWTPTMPEAWSPGADALKGAWTTGRPPSPWERVPLEQAGPGVTSLAGRVLRLHGLPLARVRLSIGPAWTCSDPSGRFLLSGIPAGIHVLRIDGGTADIGERHYGTFDTAVTVLAGATTPLPFTVWMPLLDETNSIRVPQRLRAPLVLMSPLIPGLTITIPVGASIRDASGRRVHSLTITPVPVDRAPFPTPSMGTFFPVYFTVQPAGLVIEGGSARIVYPNTTREPASRRAQFFSYEPGDGWESYGDGTVSRDGRSVVPSVGLRELVPAAMGFFGDAPENAPKTGEGPAGTGGEPVDLASGLFVEEITDLYLPDVIPIALERTYRTGDEVVRGFGIGASTPYEMFLTTRDEGRETKLVLADGEAVSFRSIGVQPGVGQVWEATTTPGTFLGARIFDAEGVAPNAHWQLVTVDGTRYLFGHSALLAISDPNGNTVTVSRPSYGQAEGPVTQVTSPNGRWIVFAYEDPLYPSLVTRVSDDAGRVVRYEYDEKGRLIAVTDPMLGTTLYAYDDQDRRTSVTTPRGIHFLRNVYDQAGRVSRQIQADGSLHTFTYTTEGGRITATDYTDPRGTLRHVVFDATGWVRSATYAVGLPEEQTWAWERQPGSGLLTAEIDGLARRTEYAYDSVGRLLSTTRLAGTPGAVSTSRVYDPITGRLAAMRDEAGHRTSVERDQRGLVTGVADASGRVWSIESDDSGALVAATDPSGGNTRVDYRLGEPTG
ncbi:MAG: DUF6531 domain-containing protein, partial [Chloroflexi bacterium]|nr:DUF6531 domain-containing protein [Chloroflexota bacterium]